MKEFWKKYFHMPEQGAVSEKVVMNRITLSVCVILLCLGAMGFSAYAYFSSGVSSSTNKIAAANYDIAVSITGTDPNMEPWTSDGGAYSVTLEAGTYTVTLTKMGNASTGFCRVVLDKEYHTQQLGADMAQEAGSTEAITFILIMEETGTVSFFPCWGTSAYYQAQILTAAQEEQEEDLYILDGETVTFHASQSVEDTDTFEPTEPTKPTEPAVPPTTAEEIVYVVQTGDTLGKIAQKYGVTVDDLVAYNNIPDPDKIYKGQIIKIPPVE